LADFEGNTRYAEFDNFAVASERDKYRLVSLGTYSGTAGQYDMRTWTELFMAASYEMIFTVSKLFRQTHLSAIPPSAVSKT